MMHNADATLFCRYEEDGQDRYKRKYFEKVYWSGAVTGRVSNLVYQQVHEKQGAACVIMISQKGPGEAYVSKGEWDRMDTAQKKEYFTLQTGDYFVRGSCEEMPDDPRQMQRMYDEGSLTRITEVKEVRTPGGRIDYWRIKGE